MAKVNKKIVGKCLIVNADDFGRSCQINQAVIRAHKEGILTSASLMVAGEAWEEAVNIATQHPHLAVGLHLVLVDGKAVLPPHKIPDLVDSDGNFVLGPVSAGMKYYFKQNLRQQLRAEIIAQLERFMATGLHLDHVNGHVNLHVHPAILHMLLELRADYPIFALRIPHEPLRRNLRIDSSHLLYKISHALIFQSLRRYTLKTLRQRSCSFLTADSVYGLLQSGRMTSSYLAGILPELSQGLHEFYFHPAIAGCPEMQRVTPDYLATEELEALTSPQIRKIIHDQDIQLVHYSDFQD